jgi:DNA mismatch repair protein MutS
VVHRAREVLEELEDGSRQASVKRRRKEAQPQQLPLLGQRSPLFDELEKLDIDSMTPLEAITRLYELQKKAKSGS